jgi:hypothetical protein
VLEAEFAHLEKFLASGGVFLDIVGTYTVKGGAILPRAHHGGSKRPSEKSCAKISPMLLVRLRIATKLEREAKSALERRFAAYPWSNDEPPRLTISAPRRSPGGKCHRQLKRSEGKKRM